MGPGESGAPSRREALDAAGRALRDAQRADRDEIRTAQNTLRRAAQAHRAAVQEARQRLDAARGAQEGAVVEEAERALAEALTAQRGVEEARPLLHRPPELLAEDETVLDMAPGISAGHDGILVATDRQVLFLSLRRTLAHPYADVRSVTAKGRWLGARLVVVTAHDRLVVSGLHPDRAADVAAIVREHLPPAASAR